MKNARSAFFKMDVAARVAARLCAACFIEAHGEAPASAAERERHYSLAVRAPADDTEVERAVDCLLPTLFFLGAPHPSCRLVRCTGESATADDWPAHTRLHVHVVCSDAALAAVGDARYARYARTAPGTAETLPWGAADVTHMRLEMRMAHVTGSL